MTPPTLPSQFTTDSTPTRTVAAWPAESHVFGAAQAVIGNATIGPHVTPQFKNDIPASPPNTVKKQSIITPAFTLPTTQANTAKDRNIDSQLLNNAGTIEEDDVFANLLLQSPEEQRKRVFDLLRVSQSRKSSLYSTTTASSFRSSATSTPLPSEAYKDYKGRPRIEEAIVDYPETILANILDHLSFRSFKNLLHSSPKLYRAAYYDEAGESRFMDIIKQRFLAPYGYLPLPSTTTTSSNNNEKTNDTVMMKNKVHFTMRDLIVFQIGIEFSISEYCIFASEHKRSPLKLSITRTLRDSTRSFNKLVIRLKIQSQYIDSLYSPLSPSPSSATSTSISTRNGQKIENIREEEEETEKEETMPKLIKPHWVNYKRIDHQLSHNYQVYKSGRCLLLRAWVPCKTQWMSNEEILQVERELHRAGIWKFLRRGDLVRNVALGDIANEGMF